MCKISVKEYGEAVVRLLSLARKGTSGSRAAAQVLLSAYDGYDWQLDICDLSLLDENYYDLALKVIRGRVELGVEPHCLIEDGGRHFGEVLDRWAYLHVKERGKTTCWDCDGRGYIYKTEEDYARDNRTPCWRCDGKGRYWES